MKHNKEELIEFQSYPLDIKLMMTQDRIRGWYKNFGGDVYVSRSGGKDSDVLGDIVKNMYPDVPHVFIDTGLEWLSVQKHGKEIADKVLHPSMNFIEVIKKYGYPVMSKEVAQRVYEAKRNPNSEVAKRFGDCEHNRKYPQFSMERYAWLLDAPFKIGHKCCEINKKRPAKKYEKETGKKPYIATMAEESRLRKSTWYRQGCNAFEATRPVSAPLSFWTEQDIFQYIKENNLEIADVYGDIVEERFYIDSPRARELVQKLVDNGELVTEQRERERVTVDLSLNNPKQKKIANCIIAHLAQDGNWIERRQAKSNGVISFVKKNEISTL